MPECWKEMDLEMGRGKRMKGMNYEEHKCKTIQGIGYRRSTWQKPQYRQAEQKQAQYERIIKERYNRKNRESREGSSAEYLKKKYRERDQAMIARFRCGNGQ